jgi:hypothetical protein
MLVVYMWLQSSICGGATGSVRMRVFPPRFFLTIVVVQNVEPLGARMRNRVSRPFLFTGMKLPVKKRTGKMFYNVIY